MAIAEPKVNCWIWSEWFLRMDSALGTNKSVAAQNDKDGTLAFPDSICPQHENYWSEVESIPLRVWEFVEYTFGYHNSTDGKPYRTW
jgi:hypothetical protein